MADTPISGFPSGSPAQVGDEFVIARSGANYKLATSDIQGYVLAATNVFTAANTFSSSNIKIKGSSTGVTSLASSNAGASNYTITFPAATDTVVMLAQTNVFTGANTFSTTNLRLKGSSTGVTSFASANSSATSYTITFPAATGTVPLLNQNNVFTGINTFQPGSDGQSGTFRRFSSGQTSNIIELQTEANAFLAGFDKSGVLTLGAASTQTGMLKFVGTTSGTVTLSTADAAGTWTMKLPTSAGTNGYVLQTDGAGVTSWVAQSGGGGSPGGSNTQVQFNNSGAFGGSANLTWVSPALTIGAQQTTRGQLVLANTAAGAFATTIQSSNSASAAWTLTLPTTAGTNGYVLQTDGSGNTSWVASGGGSSTLTVGTTATSGGAAGQIMFDTGSVLQESSSLVWNNTTKLLTVTGLGTGGGANAGGLAVTGGSITLSGNISANAWTTSGIRYKSVTGTLTDLTSSGTVAAASTNVYGGNTIAASNVTTFTNYYTTWINLPTAGANVTFTNRWALGLDGGLVIQGGTVTASAPTLNISQTWNNSAVTFTGMFLNVTDTASGGASLFADWQVGGVSRYQFNKQGTITFDDGASGNPVKARVGASGLFLRSDRTIQWSSGTTSTSVDTYLSRGGAAATLQLGQADAASPVAQTLQVQSVAAGVANTAGAPAYINGSRGTGLGVGGSLVLQVAPAGASGTAQNAYTPAITIAASKVITVADTFDLAFSTSTGSKIGTATGQKIGFWNATPIAQPTTASAAATIAATGTGNVVAASTTFDGYTIPQVVKALRDAGLLA